MNLASSSQLDLDELLKTKAILTHFQPIISLKQRAVIGYEALSRGVNSKTNSIVMPNTLFSLAGTNTQLVALDRLCREKALENYKSIAATHNRLLLFLNLETAILNSEIVGSGNLIDTCLRNKIHPSSVVIEIIESKSHDVEALKAFVKTYKNLGFLIALDDVGNAYSNLDRILYIKPDIIKIDKWLIKGIDKDYYKQEIFRSLAYMARKIGSLIIAEGVETKCEALTALQLGADMLQGYYFAKPQSAINPLSSSLKTKIGLIALLYRNYKFNKINNESLKQKSYRNTLNQVLFKLSKITPDSFENTLQEIIIGYPSIQYLYILDMDGIQITDTIGAVSIPTEQTTALYQADHKDTNQSLKDYCLFIQAGAEEYVTEPYMSLATGMPCITYSVAFTDFNNSPYILCADFEP